MDDINAGYERLAELQVPTFILLGICAMFCNVLLKIYKKEVQTNCIEYVIGLDLDLP